MFYVPTRLKRHRKINAYFVSVTLLGLSLCSVIFICFCKFECDSTVKSSSSDVFYTYKRQIHDDENSIIHVQRRLKKYDTDVSRKQGYQMKILTCNRSGQCEKKDESASFSHRLKRNDKTDNNNHVVPQRSCTLNKTQNFTNITGNYLRRLPQAIIVGVKKSGTRALLEYLRLHPDIRGTGPEPHFFDRHYHLGFEWYRNKMPPTTEGQITIEKTPRYFVMPEVPSRISTMSKHVKLIFVVRDPITRAISDYTQGSSKDPNVTETFVEKAFHANGSGGVHKNWSAIKTGIYVEHVKRWLNYFSLRQIHFVSGETLIANPAEEVQNVTDFLNLRRLISDSHFYFNETKGFPCFQRKGERTYIKCLDSSKGRLHVSVEEKYIARLRQFYRPYNEEFYKLVGKDFGWS